MGYIRPTVKYIEGVKYKQCTMCLEYKNYNEEFSWRNSSHKQKHCKCKKCTNIYREILRKRDPEKYKDRNRNKKLKQNFGIDLVQYKQMKLNQNNKCFICGLTNNSYDLAVDHNHETGDVRKLLCMNCNSGLGMVKEDYQLILKFIWYLYIHKNNLTLTFEEFIKRDYINNILEDEKTRF